MAFVPSRINEEAIKPTPASAVSTYALLQTNTGGKEGRALWICGGSLLLPCLISTAANVLFLTQAHYSSVEWDWNPQGCSENPIKQTPVCASPHRLHGVRQGCSGRLHFPLAGQSQSGKNTAPTVPLDSLSSLFLVGSSL